MTFFDCMADLVGQLNGNGQKAMLEIDAPLVENSRYATGCWCSAANLPATSAAAGPRLWNSVPVQLRNTDITYGLFQWQLKGHLFWEA